MFDSRLGLNFLQLLYRLNALRMIEVKASAGSIVSASGMTPTIAPPNDSDRRNVHNSHSMMLLITVQIK